MNTLNRARSTGLRMLTGVGCVAFALTSVAETLSDPTQPPQARTLSPKAEFSLRLEAVLADAVGRRAIIAGKLVRVGDRIDGATITHISDESVQYTVDGHEHTAQLNREHVVVKHPSSIDRDSP